MGQIHGLLLPYGWVIGALHTFPSTPSRTVLAVGYGRFPLPGHDESQLCRFQGAGSALHFLCWITLELLADLCLFLTV